MNIITDNLLLGTNTKKTLKTAVRMMHLQPKKEQCNIAFPKGIRYNQSILLSCGHKQNKDISFTNMITYLASPRAFTPW